MTVGDVLAERLPDTVREALLAPLFDHHSHPVRRDDLVRAQFEPLISQAGTPAPPGTTHFDSPVGAAIRRWCGPVLGLEPHVSPAVYLATRTELGASEVNRRLLRAAGVVAFLVDTADAGPDLLSVAEMGRLGGAAADEIVRIEEVEQEVAEEGPAAVDYVGELYDELAARAVRAVGLKSMVARHHGLDLDPARPSRAMVIAAAGRRLADPKARLADPVLLRHLLWTAVDVARDRGLPLQLVTGYGDPDIDLRRTDPALLTGFLRAVRPTGVPVILIGCYPYHRRAAYLATVFPHVYVDVGPTLAHACAGSAAIIGELLELAPFHKQLFGSACCGVAEMCHLAALFHRRGLARAAALRLERGEWSPADAARVAHMIGSGNARRLYRL
jgi:predicted TIM-barrel fold metal-dependent hydrolase